MDVTFTVLLGKQAKFKEFAAKVLPPNLLEKDLGFIELASHIGDSENRQIFCNLAIEMLDANISHYKSEATVKPAPAYSNKYVVVSTLLAGGVFQYKFGTAIALFAAGIWYWLISNLMDDRLKRLAQEVEAHNEAVPGWVDTLKTWQSTREALLTLALEIEFFQGGEET